MQVQKKYPALHQKAAANQIYIKGGRPLPVYLKHSIKVLNKYDTIIIHGMTATIGKAVTLSIKLRKQFPYLNSEVHTDSMPTIVEYKDGSKEIKQRSTIHIVLRKTDSKL